MQDAIEEIMDKISDGPEPEQKRYTQQLSVRSSIYYQESKRNQTISAIRKRISSYKEQKLSLEVSEIMVY